MTVSNSWPCMGNPKNPITCLRALSKLSLSSLRLGAVFTSLGSPFQCPNTLWGKNFFLTSNLTLPCPGFRPFPRVLHWSPEKKSVSAPLLPSRGSCRPQWGLSSVSSCGTQNCPQHSRWGHPSESRVGQFPPLTAGDAVPDEQHLFYYVLLDYYVSTLFYYCSYHWVWFVIKCKITL